MNDSATRDLVVVGAGGFGRETVEVVHAINAVRPTWRLRGFLDDGLAGTTVDGVPVIGTTHEPPDDEVAVVVCTGHPGNYFSRKRIVQRLALPAARYATVVHPAASVSAAATLGPGTVILAGAVLTASLRVGAHCALMPGVVLTHDDVVEDFATFGARATLAGRVTVGEGAYIGAGAMVREGRTVGAWSLLGMGAVALCDIPGGEVWAGVPARRLRAQDVPADVRAG